ncbi:MAG: DNA-directed RNA polymerase subunit omega [Candidatus Izemoplasmataceae bacterium]
MPKGTNHEGLRYPSMDHLLKNIDSKYKLAYTAALRAKKLKENYDAGADKFLDTTIEPKCSKPVGIALEEIAAGKIDIEFEK